MPSKDELRRAIESHNPFAAAPQRINKYTAEQIATLQSRLDKQLGPEYVSTRSGPGGSKVHYLTIDKAINLANEVFGFNGWSTEIRDVTVDFVDEDKSTGRIRLGISAIVRIILSDGTFHEDIGYGNIENAKQKANAFMKSKKEAVSDGIKRALRSFGKVLGNCLYDMEYVKRVSKISRPQPKWDPSNLHRHPSCRDDEPRQPLPQNSKADTARNEPNERESEHFGTSPDIEDDFEGNFLESVEFGDPDDICLENTVEASEVNTSEPTTRAASDVDPRQNMSRMQSMPSLRPHGAPVPPHAQQQKTNQAAARTMPPPANASMPHHEAQSTSTGLAGGGTVGFVPGRAAELVQNHGAETAPLPANVPAFNPHLESSSLRRTSGIDHNKSMPVNRGSLGQGGPPVTSAAQGSLRDQKPVTRGSLVNPQADVNRRIGMPAGAQSPHANRAGYRPPAMQKRAADGGSRPVLADVSNVQLDAGGGNNVDPKRLKVDG